MEFHKAAFGAVEDSRSGRDRRSRNGLAAETAIAVYKVAFARRISEPGQPEMAGIFRESMEELRGVQDERSRFEVVLDLSDKTLHPGAWVHNRARPGRS